MRRLLLLSALSAPAFIAGLAVFYTLRGPSLTLEPDTAAMERVYRDGESATIRVIAVNHRRTAFIVDSVSTSCGCTQPMIGPDVLAQGALFPARSRTPLDLVVATDNSAGDIYHSMRIVGFFGDRANVHAFETKVRVRVAGGVKLVPQEVLFHDALPGQPLFADVLILDGGSGDATKVKVQTISRPGSLSGEFLDEPPDSAAKAPEKGFVVKRRFRLKFAPSSSDDVEQEYIEFKVPDHDSEKSVRVSVICRKKPPQLRFSPPSLVIRGETLQQDVVREILCIADQSPNGDLSVVEKPSDVGASVRYLNNGRYLLVLTIPASRISDEAAFQMRIVHKGSASTPFLYRVLIEK